MYDYLYLIAMLLHSLSIHCKVGLKLSLLIFLDNVIFLSAIIQRRGASMPKSHKLVYAIYILVWIVMAINPRYPDDWLLENVLVFIFFPFVCSALG